VPGFKFSKRASSFADSSAADTAAARDLDAAPASSRGAGLAGATQLAGGAAAASVRSRAVALAHALDRVGPVRVSSDRLVMPVEYLRAALQQCLLLQVNEIVMASGVSVRLALHEACCCVLCGLTAVSAVTAAAGLRDSAVALLYGKRCVASKQSAWWVRIRSCLKQHPWARHLDLPHVFALERESSYTVIFHRRCRLYHPSWCEPYMICCGQQQSCTKCCR
jgi:hypothetical protein